jgi:hypothetical protein
MNEITYDPTFTEPYRVRVLETTFLSDRLKHYSGEYGMVMKRYSNKDVLVQFEDNARLLFSQDEVEVSE